MSDIKQGTLPLESNQPMELEEGEGSGYKSAYERTYKIKE